MIKPQSSTARLAWVVLLTLIVSSLAGCGGGGGSDGAQAVTPPPPDGPQGLRFSVDSSYTEMVHSVEISGPTGMQKETLGLYPGQEMFVALPTGSYALRFWIYAGGGICVVDQHRREAVVYPSQTTVVPYP